MRGCMGVRSLHAPCHWQLAQGGAGACCVPGEESPTGRLIGLSVGREESLSQGSGLAGTCGALSPCMFASVCIPTRWGDRAPSLLTSKTRNTLRNSVLSGG